MEFYENKQEPEKAVLIAVDTGEYDCEVSLDELEELAKTAGAEVIGRLWQKRDKPDNALFLGSGRLEELGEFCENNEIDLVIFLRDPLTPKSHEPDVNNVVRLCDTHNIPLATNLATAELLIKSLDRGDLEWREMYK